jgi:tetratricopeptide (TPR) repeat protein
MSRTESEGTPTSPESTSARSSLIPEKGAAPRDEAAPAHADPAAEPKQEMTLSESTLHWMVDGDQPMDPRALDPSHQSRYDFRARAASRRRTFALVGAAAGLALIIAFVLHLVAAHRPAPVDESADSASQITRRAELALAQGRSGEAIELAHLAIAANPRVPGAYAVVGAVARVAGRTVEARTAYTKYLELAPVGPHAAEARAALAALPP